MSNSLSQKTHHLRFFPYICKNNDLLNQNSNYDGKDFSITETQLRSASADR